MAVKRRIYVVSKKNADPLAGRLVDASSQAQAIRHVVGDEYQATIASTRGVANLIELGVKIETAGADNEP